jgi:transcriptional regulator with XRE-family HTH domain
MTPQVFGDKVRQERMIRGWGQEELAQRIGKSIATVSRIENGGQQVMLAEILALAAAFNMSLNDLCSDADIVIVPLEEREALLNLMRVCRRLPRPLLKRFLALAQEMEESLEVQ